MPRFVVAGLGRVGTISLLLLRNLGYEAFGISNTLESVENARRLGLKAYPGDIIANPRIIEKYGGADVVLLALPGSLGFRGFREPG
jgi:voltage-gated potassium channel Kch